MSQMTTNLPDTLLPRRYQEEVFLRAQKGNIIAALNTGSGKTLISLLLIKWVTAQEASNDKVVVFLVPRVTLVEQQGSFIALHTPLRVIKLHGALETDLSDRPGWRKKFADNDVFVMTAQIFSNFLTHSLWSIDKVSLMVFDECHHARKNHPYNGILREYFQVPVSQRPKIFGMTASPIWNPKDVVGSLTSLEANMDAEVVGVRVHVEELAEHSPKPVEIIKEYPPPPEIYDYPSPSLFMCLRVFEPSVWKELEIPWYNIEMRYHATLANLGPYSASLFLYTELQPHISRILDGYTQDRDQRNNDMNVDIPRVPSKPLASVVWEMQDILLGFQPFFSDPSAPNDIPITIPLTWCTPKIKALVDILLAYHSTTFQGIIFVEQRQVAACLAKLLRVIPQLKAIIRCAYLVGQGVGSEGVLKTTGGTQTDAVGLFRSGNINLLIATSVAEEGLDFPACDLVIRFDQLQHMVGYIQSRGRARNKASTFVIMIGKYDTAHLARYKALKEKESELNRVFQLHRDHIEDRDSEDSDGEDETHPADLASRKRYIVAATGAILTYDNSLNLISYLCALIPRDVYTPAHLPKYTGAFEATLYLPPSLPLSRRDLVFKGPPRRSKKEARRAVAFRAVKRLHELDVFDEYLLPTSGKEGRGNEDPDGRPVSDVGNIPITMNVLVRDPWSTTHTLWIHPVYIDDRRVAGLITGTVLPPVDLICDNSLVRTGPGKQVHFHDRGHENDKRVAMHRYTKQGIWLRITGRPFTLPVSLFLVPITDDEQPDFGAIESLAEKPYGSYDWSNIGEDDYDKLLIMNSNEFGCPRLLRRVRFDLSPKSVPPPGSREEGFPTYHNYFMNKWTRKKRAAVVPTDGPLIETLLLPRTFNGSYSFYHPGNTEQSAVAFTTVPNGNLVPRGCCRWFSMSQDDWRAFEILPSLCHRITDVYRAQQARIELGLPHIADNLLVQALTLPSANAGYNNQRLETLGDAVLELGTTIHLFNKYPHRHEGQLTTLRQSGVSNRYLLARAKEINLERFLTSEVQSLNTWRYLEQDQIGDSGCRFTSRYFARRSLQDCMEAILGASFVTGGIQMALHTGQALGLSLGGTLPWSLHYSRNPQSTLVPVLFTELQEKLGYTFHRSELLFEAVTHPSFSSSLSGVSYQRLEFLGDALLNLVVIKYLYDKFPEATSEQLALPRTKAVCASALASLAVRRLDLHKIILINRVELSEAINRYVPLLQRITGEEIVRKGWRYEPPKALSDVFESVMGAVLIDSAYNYEKAAAVIEFVMEDVLSALSPSMRRDPVTEFLEWMAGSGCTRVTFKRMPVSHNDRQRDGIAVLVHETVTIGPILSTSLAVARFIAAERALVKLRDLTADNRLSQLCSCRREVDMDTTKDLPVSVPPPQLENVDPKSRSLVTPLQAPTETCAVVEDDEEDQLEAVTQLDL